MLHQAKLDKGAGGRFEQQMGGWVLPVVFDWRNALMLEEGGEVVKNHMV
ncbi:hypothetical protein ACFFKB_08655 [Mameliella alba]|nr:hypothetical protein [Mameliella alba]